MRNNIRICSSRSKAGCTTCKARRIKCDEAKPHCHRCKTSNRACSYAPTRKPSRPALRMVIYTAPTRSFADSPQEKASLDFFICESRGRFPLEFSHSVLRAAYQEPVLACAINAFAALQRVYEFGDVSGTGTGTGTYLVETNEHQLQFASQQYAKALGMLRARPRHQPHDVTLICSVLFACFECLRGYRRAAIIHIASGLNLLRQMESEEKVAWGIVSRRTIRGLFTRLDSQLVEVLGIGVGETLDRDGIRTPDAMVPLVDDGPGRVDLNQSLDELMNAILREKLDSVMNPHVSATASTSSILLSALDVWHSRFANSETDCRSSSSETSDDDAVLHVWYLIGKMYLTVRPSDPETAWDQFSGEFKKIVSLCEAYISESKRKSTSRNHTFSFSLGVVPPLFITAQRCRNACIRRRAIHLLSTCERRELFWDSALAAEAAQRVMEIEESATGFDTQTQQPVDVRVRTLTAILDDEDGTRILFD